MKLYICRRGESDFVCECHSIGDGIVRYWMATRETPKTSYRVHFGRRRQSRVVSASVAYWLLNCDLRSALYDCLEETSTETQFAEFCDKAVTAGSILGK